MAIKGNFVFTPTSGNGNNTIKVTCGTTANTANNKNTIDTQEQITVEIPGGTSKTVNLIQFKKESQEFVYVKPCEISTLGAGGFLDNEALVVENAGTYDVYLKFKVVNYNASGLVNVPMIINANVPATSNNSIGAKLQSLQTTVPLQNGDITGNGQYYIKIAGLTSNPLNDTASFRFYQNADGKFYDLAGGGEYTNATDVPPLFLGTVQSAVNPPATNIINF